MKPTKLITWLFEQYQTINEKVPYINHGGCGIFAEKLYILLCSLNLKPKLIIITDNSLGMDERVKGAGYCTKHGYAFITHIVIKLNGKYIDSTGIYKTTDAICDYHKYSFRERQVSTTLTLEKLKEWNADVMQWNRKFNRKHIKTIEKKLNDCYKKAEKVLVVSKELPIFTPTN